MNKRQKKKRQKRILWEQEQKPERYRDELNHEGYPDYTAAIAIRNAMRCKKRNGERVQ